jgi:L-alanine-DL-glutamate epimerase-like enolase superfamily enzyme
MIITGIETFPLRIPFKPGNRSAASAWGPKGAVDAVIAPLCVGRDAARIGPLMAGVQDKLAVFGCGGPFTHALSAVDIALWDITGKVAGAPLHLLLGGGRDDLACYASLDAYSDPDVIGAYLLKDQRQRGHGRAAARARKTSVLAASG